MYMHKCVCKQKYACECVYSLEIIQSTKHLSLREQDDRIVFRWNVCACVGSHVNVRNESKKYNKKH